MCLTITAEPEGIDAEHLLAVAGTWPKDRLPFAVQSGGWLRPRPIRFALHACDLLSDEADWNADTWAMRPEAGRQLADAFAWLFEHIPGRLAVEALWQGERSQATRVVSPSEFIDIVRAGTIGTKTRYLIGR